MRSSPARRSARLVGQKCAVSPVKKVARTAKRSKSSVAKGSAPKAKRRILATVEKETTGLPTLDRSFEIEKWESGLAQVAGVDEAGRGPLVGNVVAAACIIPKGVIIEGVHDSKKLNEQQREDVYEKLTTHKDVIWAVSP